MLHACLYTQCHVILLVSLAVPSIPFTPHSLALPCLVWYWQAVWQRTVELLVAGRSSAESQSTVMDSSRSSCTCHWLSSRLSELGGERREGTGEEECVPASTCVYVCASGRLEVTVEGHWLGCQSYMVCVCVCVCVRACLSVCVKEREWGGAPSQQQLSEWAGVTVCLPGPRISNKRDTIQVWIHFHSPHWFVLVLFMGLLVSGNNRWFPGENVSALFFNQLSPLWIFFFFSPYWSPSWWLFSLSFFSFHVAGSRVQKVGTMPDSPADVKTQPRSTPPTMPPPPPAVSQATNRNASYTPTTSKTSKDPLYFWLFSKMNDTSALHSERVSYMTWLSCCEMCVFFDLETNEEAGVIQKHWSGRCGETVTHHWSSSYLSLYSTHWRRWPKHPKCLPTPLMFI